MPAVICDFETKYWTCAVVEVEECANHEGGCSFDVRCVVTVLSGMLLDKVHSEAALRAAAVPV